MAMATFEFTDNTQQRRTTSYMSPYEFGVNVLIDADLEVAEQALARLAAMVEHLKWLMIPPNVRALEVSIDRAPRLKERGDGA